jgi:predicted NAD/FAD-dependent oxidoreductase
MRRAAVIGAGLAGLAGARVLREAGWDVTVFDKGRGVGGRLATRRTEFGAFDHGAQFMTVRGAAFRAFLEGTEAAAQWSASGETLGWVGLPGMSGAAKALAAGLEVRTGAEISALRRTAPGWRLEGAPDAAAFDRVLLTAPAPQAARLAPEAAEALSGVEMAPCWALMLALPEPWRGPAEAARPGSGPIAWAARESGKPGRAAAPERWVIHAAPDWSRANLELDRETAAARLLEAAGAAFAPPPAPLYAAAHRWRYARVETPLGRDCLPAGDGTLVLAGDWCRGARAEAAFDSGRAGAAALLAAG